MRKIFFKYVLCILLFVLTACQAIPDKPPALTPTPAAAIVPISVLPPSVSPAMTTPPKSTEPPCPAPSPTPTPFADYAPTIRMSFEELVGDDGYYELPKGFPASGTYRVIVDIYHQVVMVFSKDDTGDYTVPVRYMLCSTGLHHKTPIGTFNMKRYHVRFGLFANDGRCGQYWSQIRGRIYFHTILYSKKNASTYLVDTYNKLGQPDSHGCIRLTVPDARWIYYHLAPGTKIEIRKGSPDDEATAKVKSQLVLKAAPKDHINLEKGNIPHTDNWSIADVPNEVPFRQGSQN
ncbi:MAG: L,D-transpeptidase [Christensenellales bacterium]